VALVGIFAVVAVLAWAMSSRSSGPTTTTPVSASSSSAQHSAVPAPGSTRAGSPPGSGASARVKALYVLSVVDATGSAPSGYVGGRQFMNDTRGGTTALPHQDGSGRVITYHEYDVNPHVSGVNRGPQRLVIGSDGSAWDTADHYVTWERLR